MSEEKYRVLGSNGYERKNLSLNEANALVSRMREKIELVGSKNTFAVIKETEEDLQEGEQDGQV